MTFGRLGDGPWDRRLSRLLLRPFAESALSPNHLTALRLVAGLAAGGLYALGGAAVHWAGGFFLIAALADHLDGELARMSGKSSVLGHLTDRVTDAVNWLALFTGMGMGLRGSFLGAWALPLGAAAGLSAALTAALRALFERRHGRRALAQPSWGGFEAEDVMYLVAPITWLGGHAYFLAAAGVGTPLFLAWQLWDIRRIERDARAP